MCTDFFLEGMKMHCEYSDGRILMGDNTHGGAVIQWPIRFQCFAA